MQKQFNSLVHLSHLISKIIQSDAVVKCTEATGKAEDDKPIYQPCWGGFVLAGRSQHR